MSFKSRLKVDVSELGYANCFWHSEASPKFLQSLVSTYRIPNTVAFKALTPCERAVSVDGSKLCIALFLIMFSYGLKLPFPHPVSEFLHHLGLDPAQLHLNAWWILICCCTLWRRALLKFNLEHANFIYCEFLLTHNV